METCVESINNIINKNNYNIYMAMTTIAAKPAALVSYHKSTGLIQRVHIIRLTGWAFELSEQFSTVEWFVP